MKPETLRLLLWIGAALSAIIGALCVLFANIVNHKITNRNEQISIQRESSINRPFIQVTPKRYNNNQFLNITVVNNQIIIDSKFEIKNTGNMATNLIKPSPHSEGVQMMNPPGSKPLIESINMEFEGIALSPGESKVITIKRIFEWPSEKEARYNLKKIYSDSKWVIDIDVSFVYNHPTDESRRFKTIGQYRIGLNEGLIIKVDYQDNIDSKN